MKVANKVPPPRTRGVRRSRTRLWQTSPETHHCPLKYFSCDINVETLSPDKETLVALHPTRQLSWIEVHLATPQQMQLKDKNEQVSCVAICQFFVDPSVRQVTHCSKKYGKWIPHTRRGKHDPEICFATHDSEWQQKKIKDIKGIRKYLSCQC